MTFWKRSQTELIPLALVLVYQRVGVHVSTVSSQCAHEFNNLVSVPHQHMALELLWVTSLVVVALFTSWIYARDHTETEGHLQTHIVDQCSALSGCVWWWFNIIKKVIATRLVCGVCVCKKTNVAIVTMAVSSHNLFVLTYSWHL